ncbi:DgyrCDS11254 [Dimorphilus gyrociliatus]|uniref:DgyrCDS11254 n=1 Tax=Dimorphilus gyrociliatus TaxID=2664684 RepID=A0A7I8W2R9_9ANNE|nr:DgyrCDS11254 [Dimorphilus gyrociliatus]
MDELNTWRRSGELSDLTIQIDDSEFNLHKFPMFIKSDYLKKKISECNDNKAVLKLSNFPGGKEIFEIVSEFCYGERSSLSQENVVQTRCAAHLLEMETTGNLASFCDRVIDDLLRNAKNSRSTSVSIEMLAVCEQLGDISDKAGIVDRCVSALIDVLSISGRQQVTETLTGLSSNWFEKLLGAARKKNMRPHIIGEMLISYLQISFIYEKDETEEETDKKKHVELADEERQHLLDDVLLKVFRDENKVGEKHALQERLNPELAVKLLSEAERLKCDVKDDLRRLCAKLVPRLKAPDLAQLPPEVVVEMVQVGETDSANKEAACKTADIYLKALADNKRLDAETFAAVLNAAPNDARTNHDNLFEVLHTLLQSG